MKEREITLATSHVDQHHEAIAPAALRAEVQRRQGRIAILQNEHDVRRLPIGRITACWIADEQDGSTHIRAHAQLFERTDQHADYPHVDGDIDLPFAGETEASIIIDTSFDSEALIRHARELCDILNQAHLGQYVKKSVTATSVMLISLGTFVVGNFLSGMIQKFGANVADRVSEHFSKRPLPAALGYVEFVFCVRVDGKDIEVRVTIDRDSSGQAEVPLDQMARLLDELLPTIPWTRDNLARVVLAYKDDTLSITYCIRRDGTLTDFEGLPDLPANGGFSVGFATGTHKPD